MTDRVVVQVPATVANLGPGFDAMGLALAWHDEVRVERAERLEIAASGLGAAGWPRGEDNLVARAIRALLGELPPVRIHKMTSIAFGRGFGSSAASIVAGLVAARALGETAHGDDDLLRLATEIEGHPDNVAPCLLGGITVVAGARVLTIAPPATLRVLVCVSPGGLATKAARAALPDSVSRAEAVANIGRAAMLAAALATGEVSALLDATDDALHQRRRFELMPDTGALVGGLRARGIAAFLSGAGPSVAAFVPEPEAADAEAAAKELAPDGWDVRLERLDERGARVVERR